jgi:hypothetical protein
VLAADGSGDAATLPQALAMALDGDTILVRPGTYPSAGVALRDRDLLIVGDGPRDAVVLELSPTDVEWAQPDGGARNFHAGLVLAKGATALTGLTVRSADTGDPAVVIVGPGTAALRDVAVEGSIIIADGATPHIEGGSVTAVSTTGDWAIGAILVGDWTDWQAPPSPLIRGVRIVSAADGIAVGFGSTPVVEDNDIAAAGSAITVRDAGGSYLRNRIVDSGTGITIGSTGQQGSPAADAAPAAAPVVEGNEVHTSGTGISLTGCARPALLDNVLDGNAIGLAVGDCQVIGGAEQGVPWRIEGNTICGNGVDVQAEAGQRPPLDADRPCQGEATRPTAVPTPLEATLPVTMALEPFAPGIERVRIHAGDRELTGHALTEVEIGSDGSVWVLGSDVLARVGGQGLQPLPATTRDQASWDLTLTADGSAWVVLGEGPAARWDGSGWSVFAPPDRGAAGAIEAAADGSVWVLWTDADDRPSVGRTTGSAWTVLPGPFGPLEGISYRGRRSFAVTPDGTAWVGGAAHHAFEQHPHWDAFSWRGLVRLDDDRWAPVRTVDTDLDLEAGPLVAGPDGSLWAYVTACERDGEVSMSASSRCVLDGATYRPWLARFDGREWRLFSDRDGVPMLEGFQTWDSRLAVAPDGTLWIGLTGGLGEGGCPGVLSFDGQTWTRYLEGECVDDLAVGPDGVAWARSYGRSDDEARDPGLFRIVPAS